ncbi:MAG: hypothetical protein ACHQKZ_11120 [Solirubrobacterales bacterium]
MPAYQLRLDPWAAEYDGAIQIPEGGEEPSVRVDTGVESRPWAPVRPAPAALPRRAFFVDGVRRIEQRLLIDDGGRTVFGLFASFGVGAVEVAGSARVGHERVGRLLVAGGGLALEPFDVAIGGRALTFLPETVAENTPAAPVQGLQNAMRRSETGLAERLAPEADVVFLDGPLTFLASARGPVVGIVKRQLRPYLDAGPAALLKHLAVGERTPIFLIEPAREPRYSWYLRIGAPRPVDSTLAGLVRLETSASLDLAAVRALADTSARYLPRFASDPARDPRAPQNLYPVGALEARLRHRLGDALVIRRATLSCLHDELGRGAERETAFPSPYVGTIHRNASELAVARSVALHSDVSEG